MQDLNSFPKKNRDKTWKEIIQELFPKSSTLWLYVTVLRGPDVIGFCYTVKTIFTCPLRGKCVYAQGVDEFNYLSIEKVEAGFIDAYKNREKLYHYFQHLTAVWDKFYPPLGKLLTEIFLPGSAIELPKDSEEERLKEIAAQYMELLDQWFERESVLMEDELEKEVNK